jgi:hypothetical protein
MPKPMRVSPETFKANMLLDHPEWAIDRKSYWEYYKRVQNVVIPCELILGLITGTVKLDWPKDTVLLKCSWDLNRNCLVILVHNPKLTSVSEGSIIPVAKVEKLGGDISTFAVVWGS